MGFRTVVESAETQGPPPQALEDGMAKPTRASPKAGSLVQSGGLGASATGVRVRSAGGKLTVIDGPFTEAKEVVGGYAVLEFESRKEAIEAAVAFMRLHNEHWPSWEGECEVRPITFLAP